MTPPRRREARHYALQGVLLAVVVGVVFPDVITRREVISPADILFQIPPWKYYAPADFERPENRLMADVVTAFFPYYAVGRIALDHGEWPLWNPYELGGIPLMANAQSAVFYPPRLLHAVLEVRWATTAYVMLKLWLCGMTAFFAGRAIRLSPALASLLSLCWTLASYNLIWAQWSLPDVSAWLPVLFAGVEFTLAKRLRRGFFTLSLGAALILYAGHPETAFTMSLGLGLYAVVRILLERPRWRDLCRQLAIFAGAWVVGLAVYAPTLLPFLEYLANSSTLFDRPHDSNITSLSPGCLIGFWVPRFFGTTADGNFWGHFYSNHIGMLYPGMAVWIGASFLLLKGPRTPVDRARALALAVVSVLLVAVTFNAPGIGLFHELPIMSATINCYHFSFVAFALPLLGILGLDHLLRRQRGVRDFLAPLALLLVMCALSFAWWRFFRGFIGILDLPGYTMRQFAFAALFGFGALAVVVAFGRQGHRGLLSFSLAVLIAADLLIANHRLNPTLPRDTAFPDTDLTDYLKTNGPNTRIGIAEANIASGLFAPYAIEEWLGYDGLYPARIMRYQKGLATDVWKVMEPVNGVSLYLDDPAFTPTFPLDEHPEWFQYLDTADKIDIYRNKRAFPRAFLVGDAKQIDRWEDMRALMKDPKFDPAGVALIERPLPRPLPPNPPDDLGAARMVSRTTTRVEIAVEAQSDAILVLSDAYYPGWTATVDGEPAEIFPVFHAFRGVVVPAGTHSVNFTYFPLSLKLGLGIAIPTLIGMMLFAAASLRKRRPSRVNR